MQRRLDPETGVNKPFKNVFMSGAYSEFFSGKGHQFSSLLMRSVFFGRFTVIFSNLSNENDSRGVRGHAPPENF